MSRPRYTIVPTDRLLWTAGVVTGASLPHWPKLPLWVPLLLGLCILWRLAAKLPRWPLPNRTLRILFAFGAFLGVLLEYGTINGVEAGSALLIVMVALKFLESHSQRDQIILVILAYFLVFASLLTERSIAVAVYLLAFVWITTAGLLQMGRHRTLLPSWPTAKLAARLLLQSVPIMLVLFLLFPRLPGPLWALPGNTSSGATGLSDTMSPGDITNLGLSDEIAFRVQFLTPPPRASELYWRGPVLSQFNGRTWFRRPGMGRQVINTLEVTGEPTEYRVMLEPNGRNWLFALDMPQSWTPIGRRNVIMNSDHQLQAFGLPPALNRIDYGVTSYTTYTAKEPLTPADQQWYTQLPEGSNPRTRALASSWLADDPTPETVIERALDVFRGPDFFYTLTPPALGMHSADEFIFETHEGFCEHYASALAIMLRAAGLPTRVVTGYQGGELNGFGDYYIVRQMDAHAWTEVWLGDRGWVRIDPVSAVAPERIAFGSLRSSAREVLGLRGLSRLPWMRQALLLWDAVNVRWNEWVIGYGPQLQRSLLQYLGLESAGWRSLLTLAVVGTVALLVTLTVYLGWTSHRHRRGDRAARSFARFARKLEAARVRPPLQGEGPQAYARHASVELPRAAGEIAAIVGSYLAARYEPDADGAALADLEHRVTHFRAAT
jgi:transglutaminase-like putative cysteine protease